MEGLQKRVLHIGVSDVDGWILVTSDDIPELIICSSDRLDALNDLLPTVQALIHSNYKTIVTAHISSDGTNRTDISESLFYSDNLKVWIRVQWFFG